MKQNAQEDPAGENADQPPSKVKTLIISNIAETYWRTYKKTDASQAAKRIEYDFLEAERGAFYTSRDKVIITSLPMNQEFLADLKNILGLKIFTNLSPSKPTYSLCTDILKDKALFTQVKNLISANPGLDLIPYYATEEFFDLISVLKQKGLKFDTPETVSSKDRFIRDHYNCKVGFRKLWEKVTDENCFVKIPEGFIVDDLAEAIDAAWWFYQHKTDFVFKYNRGTSGLGVVFYHCCDLPHKENEFKKYLRAHHKDKLWFEENFVVEKFINVDTQFYGGSPSVEFKINGGVKHQYNCLQRLGKDSYFEGILISQEAENQMDIDLPRVAESSWEFGQALEELGYKGSFDIDLVVDKKNNVYAVESNLRRTGGTHLFETAQYLFGKNFKKIIVAASRDNLPVNPKIKTYADFKAIAERFYFNRTTNEGIIPTITSFLTIGKLGYFAFAKNLKRLEELEKNLAAAIS